MTSAPTFEAIYAEHAAEVHRAAYAILRDATLAEDVFAGLLDSRGLAADVKGGWVGVGFDRRGSG